MKLGLLLDFLVVLFFIMGSTFCSAAAIVGVSPSDIHFFKVLRGGYAQRPITLTADTVIALNVSAKPYGNIASWINATPSSFLISRDRPGRFMVSVSPPSDIPNGNYTGFVRIETSPLPGNIQQGHATGIIKAVLDVIITAEVVDTQIKSCQARQFSVSSAEKGDDILFDVLVENQGNIRLKPDVTLSIWDVEQVTLLDTYSLSGEEILPTQERQLTFRVPTEVFTIGQYWVDFSVVDCFASETQTFDVLEPGTFRALGTLLRISVPPRVGVGKTAPIVAYFKNQGEKEVLAQFRGTVSRDGRLVLGLTSEKEHVPINAINNFTFYFTPKKPGKYLVSGRVFYDAKRTYEVNAVTQVIAEGFALQSVLPLVFYGLAIIIVALLFFYARKERRKHLNYLKQLQMRRHR